uniref:Uncharacterized protein n=1 Tax=Octopus bimaculoides TaxID=37653 RepID=A0A0L8G3C1_OCTBM
MWCTKCKLWTQEVQWINRKIIREDSFHMWKMYRIHKNFRDTRNRFSQMPWWLIRGSR